MGKNVFTGGPALPVPPNDLKQQDREWEDHPEGMTLRDYFAGQALAGIMHSLAMDIERSWRDGAAACYAAADAMLEAREQ